MTRRERLEAFVAEFKDTILDQSAERIQRILDETADEDWQELTQDVQLPGAGYLTLYDVDTGDCHTWVLPLVGCSAAECSPVYTHYRVITGPKERNE